MSTRLLIVRHGQTDWNTSGRFQGQTDIPLNQTGVRQAQAIAELLSTEKPEVIYTSDLTRAWKTAEIIHGALPKERRGQLIAEPRLREMCFGMWEGLTYGEIQARQPRVLQRWESDLKHNAPPGGETLLELAARVEAAYASILAAHPGGTVLLVAHGGPLQLLIAQALGMPAGRFWQLHLSNASLSELRVYPEGAMLNLLNCTEHLRVSS
ncbi:MAG: alpha-ribazole phosphatase [Chloroflexi bacterium RBG_16_57_11]|nr:MAG: alpha-ribazole phosphatase [Chloroflexi bacterium RBG_16_57_11]